MASFMFEKFPQWYSWFVLYLENPEVKMIGKVHDIKLKPSLAPVPP